MKGNLRSLSSNSSGKLNILRHDSDSLSMDGSQVGIFKESNKVSFCSFLKSKHSSSLESEIVLEVLGDFSDKSLERKLSDQQLSGLLVSSDFSQSDSSWSVSVRLLDSSSSWSRLSGSLGGKLLTRSLSSGRLSGSLLGSGHDEIRRLVSRLEMCRELEGLNE
jgi:hypothetical protein